MGVDCREILTYAENQLAGVNCEVGARNVIGRAYYACYHRIKGFHDGLETQGDEPDDGKPRGSHALLIYQLEHPGVQDHRNGASKHLGRKLKTMLARRRSADYELEDEVDKRQALQTVTEARNLFNFMDQHKF